jgi:hypothetical protein
MNNTSVNSGWPSVPQALSCAALGIGCNYALRAIDAKIGTTYRSGSDSLIGALFHKIVPTSVQETSKSCASLCSRPVRAILYKLVDMRYIGYPDSKPFELLWSNACAPIIEEAIFRLGLQGGIAHVLTQICGFNPSLANSISIACASFVFAHAHEPEVSNPSFVSIMVASIAFGVAYAGKNLQTAILAHAAYNVVINAIPPRFLPS